MVLLLQGYKNWVAKHGEEKEVPGLGLTNEQLLFVSFGQVSSIYLTALQYDVTSAI
jgi:hypothetical protein